MNEDLSAWITATVPRALGYAVSLVGNEAVAEDIVQDCFHRLLVKKADYDLPTDGTKLLFKAITNGCINWTQRRRPLAGLEAIPSGAGGVADLSRDGPLQAAMNNELSEAVDEALAELPVDQRAAVELNAVGYSAAELAEMLETTTGNARVLLHRGRQRLAERLQPFLENRSVE